MRLRACAGRLEPRMSVLRRLHAALRLGGLAAALPRAAEPLDVLRVACGAALWRSAVARQALRDEGWSRSAATRALGAARGFFAVAGSDGKSPAAAPSERESDASSGDAVGDAGLAAPAAGAAPAPARTRRAPNVGVQGEKTASGRPKPDVRTVARLVELGWWATAEKAEAALTKRETTARFAYETASPAIDWLVETLGLKKHRSGQCCAARAVYKHPLILVFSTSTLQRGWETLVLSRETGGLGLPGEVARQRVASYPCVLCYSREFVTERAAFLETLGVPDGRVAIGRHFVLLSSSDDKLRKGAEWLQSQGLDVKRVLKHHPQLLTNVSAEVLLAKLDFMRSVTGLATADIQSSFLIYSLEGRMRLRYFCALQRGVADRYPFSTLMQLSDASFLKIIDGLDEPANPEEVAAYKAHIASPEFVAYMDEQERAIRARAPRAKA